MLKIKNSVIKQTQFYLYSIYLSYKEESWLYFYFLYPFGARVFWVFFFFKLSLFFLNLKILKNFKTIVNAKGELNAKPSHRKNKAFIKKKTQIFNTMIKHKPQIPTNSTRHYTATN